MSHRILIVDDEEMIRMSLSGLLQDHGYEVVTAKNGLECIQLMSNQDFDLVMMDIVMPGINGIETLKTIKERHKTDVIMISAYADKEKAIASLRLNAYDFVEKPFESKEILNIIAHCLDRLELRKDLERKTVELATAEEKYRDLYENAPDIYHSLDKNGCIIEINQTGLNSLGYIKSELIGRHFTGLLTDNSKKEFEKDFPVLFEKGRLAERERQIIRKDGSIIDVSINTSVMYDEKGKPSVTRAIMRDITEKKKLENTLKETRDYLENLFGYANAPIIVWNPEFRITRFNRAFERMTGYAAGEVIGRELQMLFPEGSREGSLSLIARTLSGEYWESVEIPVLCKDGNTRLALWNSANIYTTDGATLIATIAQGQDITERKQAERDRRHRIRELDVLYKISRSTAQSLNLHETLKNAVDATIEALHVEAGGIFLLEPDGRTMTMRAHCGLSDEFFRNVQKINIGEGISGRAAAERKVIVLNVSDYPSERLAPFIVREGFHVLASAPLISSGETIGALNLGMRHPRTFTPEEMRLLEAIGQMLGQAVRNAQLYESVQQELAERKQAEEALRRTEENFRHSLDDSPLGVRIVTIEGETIYANRAILDIYGYNSIDELKTTPVKKRYTPESYAEFRIRREKRRQDVDDPSEYGIDIIQKNGDVRHLQVFRKEVLWDGKIQYQAIYQDVTERKLAASRELLAREVLNLLNRPEDETDAIRDILLMVKKSQGFEAVGIRLKEGDDFPYFRTDGFPDHFVKAERYLCVHNGEGKIVRDEQGNPVLECMCGNVIRGRTDAALPFFTENGSFWTNSTTDLLASTTEKDRLASTRNRCNAERYESLALIPLRSGDEIIGLLQINDRRRNRFTLEMIRFFEGLGSSIGIALSRKQQTTELIRSDRGKELLLKEIHHRVKNNLQIIASLLRLSTKYSGDERVEEIFRESQDRIRAMAAVHSMLYKSENFAEINFGDYIRETARQLFRSYNTNHEAISLLIDAEDVMLSIDTAIPCGLIINELISNALKHAFPDGRRGEIRIEMNQDENGVRIIFEDNGAGFPEGIDFRNTETLGLQLVNMLVAQLDGSIERIGNGGTRYVLTLKTGKEI